MFNFHGNQKPSSSKGRLLFFRNIGFSDSIHCPGIINKLRKTRRFGNWICFRPQVREKPILLGPLERASLNHWTTDVTNPIFPKVIHHRQNPIVTTFIIVDNVKLGKVFSQPLPGDGVIRYTIIFVAYLPTKM
jgi:hypothetical protein